MSCSITIRVSSSPSLRRSSVSSTRSPRDRPEHGSSSIIIFGSAETAPAPAEQPDGPGGGREVAADAVEKGRLAGAVRAEDRPALAGDDLEVDLTDGVKAAETPADPPQAEGRLGVFGCYCFRHVLLEL